MARRLEKGRAEDGKMGDGELQGRRYIRHFRDLDVYRMAFGSAMAIYEMTKMFPAEERYSLTDQIRRSSRSVCANIAEGWRKRKYEAVFKNKLTDAMQEASETQCWLEFALACGYISSETFSTLDNDYERIIAMLNGVEKNSNKFCY
jgi:four helix bundle protein